MNPVDRRVVSKLGEWVDHSETDEILRQRERFQAQIMRLNGEAKLLVARVALESLPRQLFTHTTFQGLRTLIIRDCSLKRFPVYAGRLQAVLESVFINRCGLREVPRFIAGLTALKRLDLDDNQITKLPPFLNDLVQLRFLNVEKNAIKRVPNLGGMRSLEVFLASNNEIEQVDIAGLASCPRLKGVDLNRNRLRALNMDHLGLQLCQWAHQKV